MPHPREAEKDNSFQRARLNNRKRDWAGSFHSIRIVDSEQGRRINMKYEKSGNARGYSSR
jgi:hypothetical protein